MDIGVHYLGFLDNKGDILYTLGTASLPFQIHDTIRGTSSNPAGVG
jgi:hypothetical protein